MSDGLFDTDDEAATEPAQGEMFAGAGGERQRRMRGFLICPACGLKRPGPAPYVLMHSCGPCMEARFKALRLEVEL
jgi:hypothetical protein